MSDSLRNKLERSGSRLDDVRDGVRESINETFNRADGEIWFHDPDAPPREMFDGLDDGYRLYLEECHEWALEELNEAAQDVSETTAELAEDDRPEIGLSRSDDVANRDRHDQLAQAASERMDDLEHWSEIVRQIEAAHNEIS